MADLDGLDGFARRDPDVLEKAVAQWQKDGTGILATSLIGRSILVPQLMIRLYVQDTPQR